MATFSPSSDFNIDTATVDETNGKAVVVWVNTEESVEVRFATTYHLSRAVYVHSLTWAHIQPGSSDTGQGCVSRWEPSMATMRTTTYAIKHTPRRLAQCHAAALETMVGDMATNPVFVEAAAMARNDTP